MRDKILETARELENHEITEKEAQTKFLFLLGVKQRFSNIKYWIEEAILELQESDDGVTDRKANAEMLINEVIKLCDNDVATDAIKNYETEQLNINDILIAFAKHIQRAGEAGSCLTWEQEVEEFKNN